MPCFCQEQSEPAAEMLSPINCPAPRHRWKWDRAKADGGEQARPGVLGSAVTAQQLQGQVGTAGARSPRALRSCKAVTGSSTGSPVRSSYMQALTAKRGLRGRVRRQRVVRGRRVRRQKGLRVVERRAGRGEERCVDEETGCC